MKTFEIDTSEFRDPDRESIEALVDGTLGEEERSALLLQLDAEPGGWRRCALAFLEDQAFRAAIVESTDSLRRQEWPAATQPAARSRIAPRAALAASLIVAFGVGWALPRPARVAQTATIAKGSSTATPATNGAQPPSSLVRMATPRGGQLRADRSESTSADDSPLSHDALARLARDGYAVEMRSGLAAILAPGGEPLPVPVAEVELRYVGNHIY